MRKAHYSEFKKFERSILNPFNGLFDKEHIFTPLAIDVKYDKYNGEIFRVKRLVYIFGFRVFSFTYRQ